MIDNQASDALWRSRVIACWLLAVAGMVFVMVVIGGVTRLTESGLSIVDWRPVTGWLPPLNEARWEEVFSAYRTSPEFREVNASMTLADFKGIFWLEYIHRLWGRLIGIAFFVPFLMFLLLKWVDRRLSLKLLVMFVLGGLQGVLGWYMVKSGLVDRPDVSQYRLTAHLGAALLIYGYILWVAWGLLFPKPRDSAVAPDWRFSAFLCAMIVLTMLSGGFVAGLNAGFAYNTFPLMDGELIPEHLFALTPLLVNFFEDVTTVQFTHRVLALTTFTLVVTLWFLIRRSGASGPIRRASSILLGLAVLQVTLGISTLVLYVPLALAAAHQAVAVLLLTAGLWMTFQLRLSPRGRSHMAMELRALAK